MPVEHLPPPPGADRGAHASLEPVAFGAPRLTSATQREPEVLPPPDVEGSHAFEPLEDLGPRLPRSKPVGAPNGGRLRHGEQLPASSESHFTFDSAQRRSPSRGWRRWG